MNLCYLVKLHTIIISDSMNKVVDIEIFMDKIKDLIKNFIVNYEYLCEELMIERIKPLTI